MFGEQTFAQLRTGFNILLFWQRSTAALVFQVGACLQVSLFYPPLSHSSPSLIGLLASVDVKQQKLTDQHP